MNISPKCFNSMLQLKLFGWPRQVQERYMQERIKEEYAKAALLHDLTRAMHTFFWFRYSTEILSCKDDIRRNHIIWWQTLMRDTSSWTWKISPFDQPWNTLKRELEMRFISLICSYLFNSFHILVILYLQARAKESVLRKAGSLWESLEVQGRESGNVSLIRGSGRWCDLSMYLRLVQLSFKPLPVTASHFRLWIGNRWKEMEIDRWIGGQRDHITLRLFLFAGKWMSHIVLFRNLDRLIDLPR